MPEYVVGVNKDLTEEQWQDARRALEQKGGKITSGKDEFKRDGLSPGFKVEFPAHSVQTLNNESIPHFYSIEKTQDFKTQ